MRYSEERNIQMLVYLMKQYGIHNVIVCPGAGNITFVATIQTDPFFHLWSVIDERSAVYMACGLAQETGEPVCVSVTCNAAVRNGSRERGTCGVKLYRRYCIKELCSRADGSILQKASYPALFLQL